eukprot:scaffold54464_cov14-Tisochrysis_lutea.AAC.1
MHTLFASGKQAHVSHISPPPLPSRSFPPLHCLIPLTVVCWNIPPPHCLNPFNHRVSPLRSQQLRLCTHTHVVFHLPASNSDPTLCSSSSSHRSPQQVSALRSQQLNAALKDLQLATGSDRDTAGVAGAAGSGAGAGATDGGTATSTASLRPAPFREAARCVQASASAAFRRAFAEDLRLEGTEWDGRAATAEFERELAERVEALRGERVGVCIVLLVRVLRGKL